MTDIDANQYPIKTLPLSPMEEGARKVLTGPVYGGVYEYEPSRDIENESIELLKRTDFQIGVKGARHYGMSHPSEIFLSRVLELGLEPAA